MPLSALEPPQTDPTPIFDLQRASFASELLIAATHHFKLFERLAASPLTFDALAAALDLAPRPAVVLCCALRAMGLLAVAADRRLQLTALAREHLNAASYFDVSDYLGLAAQAPGVQEIIERLTANTPAGQKPNEQGAAFIFREGLESAMEKEATARHFTLALCGRAKNVAPLLAERLDLSDARVMVDVGGGTGIYSIACLQRNPALRAVVWDRPEVLKVAEEMAAEYGVADRLELRPGDMFVDAPPQGDVVLLSNILHDWDVPQCRQLVGRLAAALPVGGRLVVHDAFLNDDLSGPLPVALYSAALFCVCEGRAYAASEHREWLVEAGLHPGAVTPTLIHCGLLTGVKQR
jgi:predicted O-methyltransferase YrrM